MAVTFGKTGWRAFGRLKEATFDSVPATINNIEPHMGSEPFNFLPDLVSDADENSGYEEITRQQLLAVNATAEHRSRMTPNGLGLFLGFALGNVSTVANEPASGWYTHTFSPIPTTFASAISALDAANVTVDDQQSFPSTGTIKLLSDGATFTYSGKTSTTTFSGCSAHRATVDNEAMALVDNLAVFEMPSMSIAEYLGTAAAPQYLYTGVVVPKVGFSVQRKNPALLEASFLGSGTRATCADARPTFTGEPFLKGGDLLIERGGTWNGKTWAAGTSITALVQSAQWSYMNAIEADDGFGLGGGLVRTRAVREGRSQELSASIELAASTYLDLLTAQTDLTVRFQFTGSSNYKATFVFPKTRMKAVPISGGRGRLVQNVEFLVAHEADKCSVQVEVINQVAGYTH